MKRSKSAKSKEAIPTIEITDLKTTIEEYEKKSPKIGLEKSDQKIFAFYYTYGKAFYEYASQHTEDPSYIKILEYAKRNFMFAQGVKACSGSKYNLEIKQLLPNVFEILADHQKPSEEAAANYYAAIHLRLQNFIKNPEELKKIIECYHKEFDCFKTLFKYSQCALVAKQAHKFLSSLVTKYPEVKYYEEQKEYFSDKTVIKNLKAEKKTADKPPAKKIKLDLNPEETVINSETFSVAEVLAGFHQQAFNDTIAPHTETNAAENAAISQNSSSKMKITSLLS